MSKHAAAPATVPVAQDQAGTHPEPVLDMSLISTLVHVVVLVGGWCGVSLSETNLNHWAVAFIGLGLAVFTTVTHFIGAVRARALVTPTAAPKDNTGAQLVPADVEQLLSLLPRINGAVHGLIDLVHGIGVPQTVVHNAAAISTAPAPESIISDEPALDYSGADTISDTPAEPQPGDEGAAHAGRGQAPETAAPASPAPVPAPAPPITQSAPAAPTSAGAATAGATPPQPGA